jgi:hypothetical protein
MHKHCSLGIGNSLLCRWLDGPPSDGKTKDLCDYFDMPLQFVTA